MLNRTTASVEPTGGKGSPPPLDRTYITPALTSRRRRRPDHRGAKVALQELAALMADAPDEVLGRFVEQVMTMTGATAAGLSLIEPDCPDRFVWRHVHGALAPFEGATTPRDFSPCGVTLESGGVTLAQHPERVYDWIAAVGLVIPEVLLVPLVIGGHEAVGTLWLVAPREEYFDKDDARTASDLAAFVGIALRMAQSEAKLRQVLAEQETLAREMSHRVKNVFTVFDGMIRISANNASDPREMADALSGRLQALVRAHGLISRQVSKIGSSATTFDLRELIPAVVQAHAVALDKSGSPFRIAGPNVECGGHAANGIALVVHELATNAVKYGALSERGGTVDVSWATDGKMLRLTWCERDGVQLDGAPQKTGFGGELIHRTVVRQFKGSIDYDWAREGLTATISLPLAKLST